MLPDTTEVSLSAQQPHLIQDYMWLLASSVLVLQFSVFIKEQVPCWLSGVLTDTDLIKPAVFKLEGVTTTVCISFLFSTLNYFKQNLLDKVHAQ